MVARRRAYHKAKADQDPRILEHQALAYVRRALARNTIVPPRVCDHCAMPKKKLAPFHPDPRRPREIAWLCEQDRRSVPALGGEIFLGWQWPGVAGDAPRRSRRLEVDDAWVSAANAAVLAEAPGGRINDPQVLRRWAAALFEHAPAGFADRLYGLAPRGRLKHLEPRLLRLLQWWVEVEREQRNRRAHSAREDVGVERAFEPRVRQRRRRAVPTQVDAIGNVLAPPTRSAPPIPPRDPNVSDDELLARIDDSLAAVDALLARFEQKKA